jgi:AbrB family looped-hinge helix DNA binding protein
MKIVSTLSSKYQVSIPKAVRDQLTWRPGQKLIFIPKGNGVLMMPAPEREALFGLAPGVNVEGYRDRNDRF